MKYGRREARKRPHSVDSSVLPWQPSTWPPAPAAVDEKFVLTLGFILDGAVIEEIRNVVDDAMEREGSLVHRGHVIAIALMCAVDAVASYGYRGEHFAKFVKAHFPAEYHPFAEHLYVQHRNNIVHSWNLFEASIEPGEEPVREVGDSVSFGLLNFLLAFEGAVEGYLVQLRTDPHLQANTLNRYRALVELA